MEICNIYPVANQQWYSLESYCMILAHLLKKGLYQKEYFRNDQYIIMDNGLYEGEQVSTNLTDLISLAYNSNIPIREIVVPDVLNDAKKNRSLFLKQVDVMTFYTQYRYMFVAQSTTLKELEENIDFINKFHDQHPNIRLSVGISKLSPITRECFEACEIYKKCELPIHFLGIKKDIAEVNLLQKIIRSCDTSQLCHNVKNATIHNVTDGWSIYRPRSEDDVNINLEKDVLNNISIKESWIDAHYGK